LCGVAKGLTEGKATCKKKMFTRTKKYPASQPTGDANQQRDRVYEKARKTSKQGKKARESTVSGDPLTQRAI
jgi:hypothetical protein